MAYIGIQTPKDTDEQMGAFSGYIRRPIPTVSGMTAQVFGENGEDADTILALSLSKYQDAQVFVNIYLVKDSLGRLMKQGEKYPIISSFQGFVRRSMPKKDGMIAQFFAPNGEHADSVSELSKSDYQDCLVFVDVRGSKSIKNNNKIQQENHSYIDSQYSEKITILQKQEYAKKEKAFKKMNELLEFSNFITKIEVMTSIGNSKLFKNWLINTQTCSHLQEKPCLLQSNIISIDFLLKPFNYLPVCEEHFSDLNNPQHLEENKLYYEMKHKLLLKQWVWQEFKKHFSFDGLSEPDPNKIIEWAASKNLSQYLPSKYQPIL